MDGRTDGRAIFLHFVRVRMKTGLVMRRDKQTDLYLCICRNKYMVQLLLLLLLPVQIFLSPPVVLPSVISCFALVREQIDSNTTRSQK